MHAPLRGVSVNTRYQRGRRAHIVARQQNAFGACLVHLKCADSSLLCRDGLLRIETLSNSLARSSLIHSGISIAPFQVHALLLRGANIVMCHRLMTADSGTASRYRG